MAKSALALVPHLDPRNYTLWKEEHDEPVKRPYRLWDALAKRDMAHRYYLIQRKALDAALLEAAWAKVRHLGSKSTIAGPSSIWRRSLVIPLGRSPGGSPPT